MIGSKFSRHFFNQSEVKPNPIVARECTFSRALCRLRVITSSFNWFTGLSPSFLIDQSNFYDAHLKTAQSVKFLSSGALMGNTVHRNQLKWNVVLEEWGKREYPRKNLSEQGPVSRKSRNFTGHFRMSQFPMYLKNGQDWSRQTSQSFCFLLPWKHVKRWAFQSKRLTASQMAFRDFREKCPRVKNIQIEFINMTRSLASMLAGGECSHHCAIPAPLPPPPPPPPPVKVHFFLDFRSITYWQAH